MLTSASGSRDLVRRASSSSPLSPETAELAVRPPPLVSPSSSSDGSGSSSSSVDVMAGSPALPMDEVPGLSPPDTTHTRTSTVDLPTDRFALNSPRDPVEGFDERARTQVEEEEEQEQEEVKGVVGVEWAAQAQDGTISEKVRGLDGVGRRGAGYRAGPDGVVRREARAVSVPSAALRNGTPGSGEDLAELKAPLRAKTSSTVAISAGLLSPPVPSPSSTDATLQELAKMVSSLAKDLAGVKVDRRADQEAIAHLTNGFARADILKFVMACVLRDVGPILNPVPADIRSGLALLKTAMNKLDPTNQHSSKELTSADFAFALKAVEKSALLGHPLPPALVAVIEKWRACPQAMMRVVHDFMRGNKTFEEAMMCPFLAVVGVDLLALHASVGTPQSDSSHPRVHSYMVATYLNQTLHDVPLLDRETYHRALGAVFELAQDRLLAGDVGEATFLRLHSLAYDWQIVMRRRNDDAHANRKTPISMVKTVLQSRPTFAAHVDYLLPLVEVAAMDQLPNRPLQELPWFQSPADKEDIEAQ